MCHLFADVDRRDHPPRTRTQSALRCQTSRAEYCNGARAWPATANVKTILAKCRMPACDGCYGVEPKIGTSDHMLVVAKSCYSCRQFDVGCLSGTHVTSASRGPRSVPSLIWHRRHRGTARTHARAHVSVDRLTHSLTHELTTNLSCAPSAAISQCAYTGVSSDSASFITP